eukprot:COSAG02_NODE_8316_length_2619_cov_20.653968_5_plen_27_part_01
MGHWVARWQDSVMRITSSWRLIIVTQG